MATGLVAGAGVEVEAHVGQGATSWGDADVDESLDGEMDHLSKCRSSSYGLVRAASQGTYARTLTTVRTYSQARR